MTSLHQSLPVVIIGGGFAGVTLAQHLEKQLDDDVGIVVISRDNHLVFTPMLAEVAARTVSPLHVVVAGRQMTKRTRWIAASVSAIDVNARCVHFELSYGGKTSIAFGHLVLACGMDVNLNEIPGMAAHALPLKSIEDAFRLGNALIGNFEQAAVEADPELQAKLLTTVVIGGGFSGVEIAGHLHDLAKNMRRYYQFAKGVEPSMHIVHRGERVIPELQHTALSEYAVEKLRKNGIQVLLKTGVREISKSQVHLGDGNRMSYGLLIGTVGNTASTFIQESGLPLERNRLKTDDLMQVEGHKAIWALGDCAVVPNAYDGKPSPPTAQFALRQAKQLAANIRCAHRGEPLRAFSFRPQGLLASIGQRNGVAEVYGVKFSGIIAWFFWRAVYLMKMPSLSRRVGIGVDWLMNALFPENLVRIGDRAALIQKEHYVEGDIVYRQGQPARTLYLIEKGEAHVYRDSQEDSVATLQPGEHFGLSALEKDERQRSTTIAARSDLDLIAFERPRREQLSESLLNRELLRLLEAHRLRQSWQQVVERFPEVDRLTVVSAMVDNPPTLKESETLEAALDKISSAIALPVIDVHGRLTGYCTRANLNSALARGLAPETPAAEFASAPVGTLAPEQPLRNAVFDYLRSGLDAVPVVDAGGRLLGIFAMVEGARLLLQRSGKKSLSQNNLS